MLKLVASLSSLLSLLPLATAQAGAYGQCGGIGWSGPTTCVSGYTCETYYEQCLPGTAPPPPVPTTVTTTVTATITTTVTANPISTTITPTSTTTTSTNTTTTSFPGSTATMDIAAAVKIAGKLYFGSATDNPELTDVPYVTELNNTGDFMQITPGNSLKWDATEPEQGVFTFAGGDQIVDLAQGNGQMIRGHNCVWYNQLPDWVTADNFDNATLLSVVANHCGTIVGHYAGQIWDVINEPFNDDGTWRQDVFYNTTGESFVAVALQAARAADPLTKLYINDYNLEYGGAKADAMANLVASLKAQGVPVDGVGMQGHLLVGEVPGNIADIMTQFTSLGVEVAITELDIRMTLPETDALLEQQKQDYQTVISACNSVPGCIGVTVWDYTDKYSWIPSTFPGMGAACPWDANLVKKPAYDGIIAGFTT